MRPPKVPVGAIVLVVVALLLACCAGWAVLVQHVVPSICHYPPSAEELAGPIRCEK